MPVKAKRGPSGRDCERRRCTDVETITPNGTYAIELFFSPRLVIYSPRARRCNNGVQKPTAKQKRGRPFTVEFARANKSTKVVTQPRRLGANLIEGQGIAKQITLLELHSPFPEFSNKITNFSRTLPADRKCYSLVACVRSSATSQIEACVVTRSTLNPMADWGRRLPVSNNSRQRDRACLHLAKPYVIVT